MGSQRKTITVLGPDKSYLSHCTWQRASILLENERAERIDAFTIMLKETKQDRKKKTREIIEQAGRVCYICGETIAEDEPATIDHVIPKSKDKYADVYENMRCCCDRCNIDKGNMTPIEYLHFIQEHPETHGYLSEERLRYLEKFLVEYQIFWEHNHKRKNVCIDHRGDKA